MIVSAVKSKIIGLIFHINNPLLSHYQYNTASSKSLQGKYSNEVISTVKHKTLQSKNIFEKSILTEKLPNFVCGLARIYKALKISLLQPHTPSIQVREHSSTPLQLATLTAHDKDSGIYGQVIYSLESDSPQDLDLFSGI